MAVAGGLTEKEELLFEFLDEFSSPQYDDEFRRLHVSMHQSMEKYDDNRPSSFAWVLMKMFGEGIGEMPLVSQFFMEGAAKAPSKRIGDYLEGIGHDATAIAVATSRMVGGRKRGQMTGRINRHAKEMYQLSKWKNNGYDRKISSIRAFILARGIRLELSHKSQLKKRLLLANITMLLKQMKVGVSPLVVVPPLLQGARPPPIRRAMARRVSSSSSSSDSDEDESSDSDDDESSSSDSNGHDSSDGGSAAALRSSSSSHADRDESSDGGDESSDGGDESSDGGDESSDGGSGQDGSDGGSAGDELLDGASNDDESLNGGSDVDSDVNGDVHDVDQGQDNGSAIRGEDEPNSGDEQAHPDPNASVDGAMSDGDFGDAQESDGDRSAANSQGSRTRSSTISGFSGAGDVGSGRDNERDYEERDRGHSRSHSRYNSRDSGNDLINNALNDEVNEDIPVVVETPTVPRRARRPAFRPFQESSDDEAVDGATVFAFAQQVDERLEVERPRGMLNMGRNLFADRKREDKKTVPMGPVYGGQGPIHPMNEYGLEQRKAVRADFLANGKTAAQSGTQRMERLKAASGIPEADILRLMGWMVNHQRNHGDQGSSPTPAPPRLVVQPPTMRKRIHSTVSNVLKKGATIFTGKLDVKKAKNSATPVTGPIVTHTVTAPTVPPNVTAPVAVSATRSTTSSSRKRMRDNETPETTVVVYRRARLSDMLDDPEDVARRSASSRSTTPSVTLSGRESYDSPPPSDHSFFSTRSRDDSREGLQKEEKKKEDQAPAVHAPSGDAATASATRAQAEPAVVVAASSAASAASSAASAAPAAPAPRVSALNAHFMRLMEQMRVETERRAGLGSPALRRAEEDVHRYRRFFGLPKEDEKEQ